jgi:hypothetical protein
VTLAGGLLDVVSIALSSGVSFASLLAAIFAWRSVRPRDTTITIRKGDSQVTLSAKDVDPEVMQSLLRQLEAEETPDRKKRTAGDGSADVS